LADRLARAAVGNVGDWVSEHHITRREHRASACVSPGLKESGYVEGENVAIDYHWAENQSDRLEEFAADLVRRRVALIVTSGGPASAFAAKAATATIPIVFVVNEDPVKLGLVASLARPGGNLTGFNIYFSEVVAKRLALLRELVPTAIRIAVLVNPVNATVTETTVRDVKAAARTMGCKSKSLMPAPAARSIQPSQLSRTNGLMHFSSPVTPTSPTGECSWPRFAWSVDGVVLHIWPTCREKTGVKLARRLGKRQSALSHAAI
jgi:ABC transporter substrate binding protein